MLRRLLEPKQYLCGEYVTLLEQHGFWISNSRKGNPYDNAWTERFMRTLKQEEVYLANYETYLDVIENLPAFIEDVYNERRIHSSIDYLTPNELEERVRKDPTNPDNRRFDLPL
jgi:putative transposase